MGFDRSLEGFEAAARLMLSRVPEMRVVVDVDFEKNVRDERRDQVIARVWGGLTPAQRALAQLGRGGFGGPRA